MLIPRFCSASFPHYSNLRRHSEKCAERRKRENIVSNTLKNWNVVGQQWMTLSMTNHWQEDNEWLFQWPSIPFLTPSFPSYWYKTLNRVAGSPWPSNSLISPLTNKTLRCLSILYRTIRTRCNTNNKTYIITPICTMIRTLDFAMRNRQDCNEKHFRKLYFGF